ncbi:GNAT family N-acetyltransferase [Jeotgalibacillus sp. R-1-5s-1]|uniref:GNAT family N-acetyltransferase n=1 Tax=Jeotgalibacillus sp. R-1-5s-1 TaxID=2555897 RepID=UPI001FC8084A|nr:GNAT family N-acetyltransferase [Jeotgalibacillus sp. R-1-5s-1]
MQGPRVCSQMKEVYESVGWMKHTELQIERVFQASTHYILAKHDHRIIGFSRALSDGVFNAAIYDVVVHQEYQGQGIAQEMMERLIHELGDLSCIHLISTTGNEKFYKKTGFQKVVTGMARYRDPHLKEEYLEKGEQV